LRQGCDDADRVCAGIVTPSHAVKKGRRYRYYVSAALITDAGTDREGWRLAAREIEEAVIRILADALTSPASLVERFGAAGMPSGQVRKLLSPLGDLAANWQDGREKLFISYRLLELRRRHPALFAEGDYQPIEVEGERSTHICAFARNRGDENIVVAVPPLVRQLYGSGQTADWGATEIIVSPRGGWQDVLTGQKMSGRDRIRASELLGDFRSPCCSAIAQSHPDLVGAERRFGASPSGLSRTLSCHVG
jgi:hypothetical protein